MVLDPEDGDQYAYFILRPEYGVSPYPCPGERVNYETALGFYSSAGVVDVAHITGIDTGTISTTTFSGTPSCLFAQGYENEGILATVEAQITYDGGGTNVPTDPDGGASVFLVQLSGNVSGFIVLESDGDEYVTASTMADGGQSVVVYGGGIIPLQTSLWGGIKIWRVVEGDTPPPTQPEFWTSFVGSREII